jgi:hypothetical protein
MTTTLLTVLQTADMLEINGLYAWQFELHSDPAHNGPALRIECMDGRDLRKWQFSLEQIAAAQHNLATDSWAISDAKGSHELKALAGINADNSDAADDTPEDDVAEL